MRWVAQRPPGAHDAPAEPPEPPYTGPPFYPAPPRWGFPNLAWRWPTMVPGTPSALGDPAQQQWQLARKVLVVLIATATLAVLSAASELWRYVLLAQSRTQALSGSVVRASDAFVLTTTLLTFITGAVAIGLVFWWLGLARDAAVRHSGVAQPRGPGEVAAAVFTPVLNLVLVGPVAAELEHVALGRPAGERPRPTRLLYAWWAAFVANGVLTLLTLVWRFRDGVQAQADAVFFNCLTYLAAAVLAGLTGALVYRLAALLAPTVARMRPMRVLAVRDAPAPALRAERPVGATR